MAENILHDENEKKFYTVIDGEEALLQYQVLEDRDLDFFRTFVPQALRGRGLAEKLVLAGFEFAKTAGLKIRPGCSYVERYFDEHPEWAGLRK